MPSDEFITSPQNLSSKLSFSLVTEITTQDCKVKKMVKYALVGMDNLFFVSTYMLQLPDKATLEKFFLDEMDTHSEQ